MSLEALRRAALEDGAELIVGEERFNAGQEQFDLPRIAPPAPPPPAPRVLPSMTRQEVVDMLGQREQIWAAWMQAMTKSLETMARPQIVEKRPRKWVFQMEYQHDRLTRITANAVE